MLIAQDEMSFFHICTNNVEELELNLQGIKKDIEKKEKFLHKHIIFH